MTELNVALERYRAWLADPAIDEETKRELRELEGQEPEIVDRFYRELEFGTGGLRGVMGAGLNRMNAYTVGKATQGLANWLLARREKPSVVIAHDSRRSSDAFALTAAEVLAGNGIRAYLWPSLRPTPQLSFTVRHLGADAGVVITASHNPPEYNGYKVYGPDGCQIVPDLAAEVIARIREVGSFAEVKRMPRAEAEAAGLIVWLGEREDRAYHETVAAQCLRPELIKSGAGNELSIIYTPLHGAGNVPVREVLKLAGFGNVRVVAEQERPDGNFPTVKSPNPEEREAFTLAIEQAKREGADLIIGTDPDCDRVGAVVKDDRGEYIVLNGNQTGAILVHYLLTALHEQGRLPANGAVIKTIVTGEMGADIARSFGVRVDNTLTGFKYIGERMTRYEQTGEATFLFGYEESYGYLAGTYARDKDGVVASLLIAEAAAYYKRQGKTLYDVLLELYGKYGYYFEALESRTLKGIDGVRKIRGIMEDWRTAPPSEVAGVEVERVLDYLPGLDGLPPENVLKFMLADGSWFCLRPSGTEPKIKVYFAVRRSGREEAESALRRLVAEVMERVDKRS
ncbi:MAG: phosphoglucomutase [Thermobacillus sp. ZCTH02-B1]|uniref:phospho-sugar mutase n=1 Tax=Thermobacillus sp. ZCTH02-B1 TaxID=1858795 RepID=UPI000B553524|nr:phospho-sugar mutase [Thermobacillus sp. ZCTH02-B1]OUM94949.1 MAG: phosphoglucomutase [Thermobacillus sp. ZCTH02-B1]